MVPACWAPRPCERIANDVSMNCEAQRSVTDWTARTSYRAGHAEANPERHRRVRARVRPVGRPGGPSSGLPGPGRARARGRLQRRWVRGRRHQRAPPVGQRPGRGRCDPCRLWFVDRPHHGRKPVDHPGDRRGAGKPSRAGHFGDSIATGNFNGDQYADLAVGTYNTIPDSTALSMWPVR